MDWKNRSKEELRENAESAYNAYADADAAASAADAAYAAADAAYAEFWIKEYFENTGEDREEYEKALKEMKR